MPTKKQPIRLADAVAATNEMRGPQSAVDVALTKMKDDEHPDYEDALAILKSSPTQWPHTRTAKILTAVSGHKVPDGSVSNWRKKL